MHIVGELSVKRINETSLCYSIIHSIEHWKFAFCPLNFFFFEFQKNKNKNDQVLSFHVLVLIIKSYCINCVMPIEV